MERTVLVIGSENYIWTMRPAAYMVMNDYPKLRDYYLRHSGLQILILDLIESLIIYSTSDSNGRESQSPDQFRLDVPRVELVRILIDEHNRRIIRDEKAKYYRSPHRHPTELDRILKDLVEIGVLKKTYKVVMTRRAKSNKQKFNSFYMFNMACRVSSSIVVSRLMETRFDDFRKELDQALGLIRELISLEPTEEYLQRIYGTSDPTLIMKYRLGLSDFSSDEKNETGLDESTNALRQWRQYMKIT